MGVTTEGYAAKTTCQEWQGPDDMYQDAAAIALAGAGHEIALYSWQYPTCVTRNCVEPTHLRSHAPVRIAYPYGICIYCGRSAGTKDHLLPKSWTGETVRRFTAVVPACGTCNTLLGTTLTWSVTERRTICHERLRKKFQSVLRTHDFTKEELKEYGVTMRNYLIDELDKKREVERMLRFPEDPFYDLRAFEKSGIENPYQVGLLLTGQAAA